jgi:hypothetical protein
MKEVTARNRAVGFVSNAVPLRTEPNGLLHAPNQPIVGKPQVWKPPSAQRVGNRSVVPSFRGPMG